MFRWTTTSRKGWLGLRGQPGSVFAEIANARTPHGESFGSQETAFELEIATVSAEFSRGGYDPVAGDVALSAVAHDIADGSRSSGSSGRFRDVAVRGNLADGNATDDR